MRDFFEYGNKRIEFSLKKTNRKTLGISILPNGEVEVISPNDAPIEKIKSILLKRAAWILEQKRLSQYIPLPLTKRNFISGESYFFLGRHLRLKVFEASYNSADRLDDRLILNCVTPEDEKLKNHLILNWYTSKANEILNERFCFQANYFSQNHISVTLKKLSKSWGEFHPDKKQVTLNTELIVAPIECVDYVIVHELCHEYYDEHCKLFYNLLQKRLSNWQGLKNTLETFSHGLEGLYFEKNGSQNKET